MVENKRVIKTTLAAAVLAIMFAANTQVGAVVIITDLNTGLDWTVLDQENDNDANGQVVRTGTWERVVLGGNSFNGIGHRAEANSGATNTWTYFNLDPGTYEVAANWEVRPGQAAPPGAEYSVNGGPAFFLLQNPISMGPPDIIDLGGAGNPSVNSTGFQIISTDAVVGAGGTLSLVLSDVSTGRVMADAIAIRQLPASNPIPEPSTYLVFGGLALCFGVASWWRKRRKAA